MFDGTNLGIGTVSPSQKLEVNGYILSDRYYPKSTNGTFLVGDGSGMNVSGDGYFYVPASGGSYFQGAVRLRGAVSSDAATYLNISGGTSGHTYFAGNVGIGTTTPSYNLDVVNNSSVLPTLRLGSALASSYGGGGNIIFAGGTSDYVSGSITWVNSTLTRGKIDYNAVNDIMTFSSEGSTVFINNTAERMRIDSTGQVGIGTTAPAGQFEVYTDYYRKFGVTYPGAYITKINLGSDADLSYNASSTELSIFSRVATYGSIVFGTGTTEKMRLNNAGYLGIATAGPSYPLHVATNVGGTSIYATNDIVAFSDQSVKNNIRPIENVIERINNSRGVLYDRTDCNAKDNIGFIAQELEVAFPELVITNEDGTKAVKYQNTVAVLFEAIKEQQKQIDQLKQTVDGLTK